MTGVFILSSLKKKRIHKSCFAAGCGYTGFFLSSLSRHLNCGFFILLKPGGNMLISANQRRGGKRLKMKDCWDGSKSLRFWLLVVSQESIFDIPTKASQQVDKTLL